MPTVDLRRYERRWPVETPLSREERAIDIMSAGAALYRRQGREQDARAIEYQVRKRRVGVMTRRAIRAAKPR